ncbi:hypothetical protein B843_10130 [Corynebacterium vitaeruminis DSM 20294]|uniref:Uncharacterized protein n=1 Tax=Corynebacterium vitaeruminis DSM 20294 TaxID=1224164 RepID=W5Y2E3_9CORY|nr:hypothetical protein B843_10130 [Corynebacterium vitaeruminis DSM 20294]
MLPADGATNASFLHQPFDCAPSDMALPVGGEVMVLVDEGMKFPCPIDIKIAGEKGIEIIHEDLVSFVSVAGSVIDPGVVSTWGDLDAGVFEHAADRLDPESVLVLGDEIDDYR